VTGTRAPCLPTGMLRPRRRARPRTGDGSAAPVRPPPRPDRPRPGSRRRPWPRRTSRTPVPPATKPEAWGRRWVGRPVHQGFGIVGGVVEAAFPVAKWLSDVVDGAFALGTNRPWGSPRGVQYAKATARSPRGSRRRARLALAGNPPQPTVHVCTSSRSRAPSRRPHRPRSDHCDRRTPVQRGIARPFQAGHDLVVAARVCGRAVAGRCAAPAYLVENGSGPADRDGVAGRWRRARRSHRR